MNQNAQDRKKLRRKFKRFWSPSEIRTPLYQRIWKENSDHLDWLIEQAEEMSGWCASKQKKFSLLRFSKWVKKAIEWGHGPETDNNEEDVELQKSKDDYNKWK